MLKTLTTYYPENITHQLRRVFSSSKILLHDKKTIFYKNYDKIVILNPRMIQDKNLQVRK
mgnify:CR=1 FL=1